MSIGLITRRGGIVQDSGQEIINYPEMSYTGNWDIIKYPNGDWVASFLSSGTLTVSRLGNTEQIDVFLVGGGGNGTNNYYKDDNLYGGGDMYYGGSGGGGGEVKTQKAIALEVTNYPLTIGAAEGATSGFGFSAVGAKGATGATGSPKGGEGVASGTPGADSYAGDGKNGQYAFGEANFYHYKGKGYRFAASGGGGSGYGYGTTDYGHVGAAGKDGAGKGASYQKPGTNAEANSGSGAGGCGGKPSTNTKGIGGSGIVIIRNAR